MQLSSRILTALAVLILAVAVVAVRGGSSGTVEAATGTIDVLNVGTCYTTSTDVFGVSACDDGDGNAEDTSAEGYNVAGRDAITKVDSVFATYAIDPKTSGDQPRAIAINSDVIKISIEDEGRDKRTGVFFEVAASNAAATAWDPTTLIHSNTPATTTTQGDVVSGALKGLAADLGDPIALTDADVDAYFNNADATINNSGDAEFRLVGNGSPSYPMADEDQRGKFFWFGTFDNDTTDGDGAVFTNLTGQYINLDEDTSSGDGSTTAPWMRVTASIPSGAQVIVQYIYYQTSDREDLIGGGKDGAYPDGAEAPVFFDKEKMSATNSNPAALVLSANGDGVPPTQNLWLKEKGRFSGRYEGYLRLTDADGDGSKQDDPNTPDKNEAEPKDNWGLATRDATSSMMDDAANLAVESGPVTITYKSSKGDTKSVTIQIDKDPPAIQIDSPAHDTASKDDSPDLIGSFSDGGGSGLREDSFKIYADNTGDGKPADATPIWDLRVNDAANMDMDRGYVCVDADEDGTCEAAGVAVLRAHYAGYSATHQTFGIIKSVDVYKPEDGNPAANDGDEYKAEDAEDYEDGATSGTFDTVVRIDFEPDPADNNQYNHEIDIQAVVMDVAGNIGFSDSEPSDPTFIHDYGTKTDAPRDAAGKHNVIGWYSRHAYFLDDVDPKYVVDDSATGFFLGSDGKSMRTNSGVMVVFDGRIDASSVGIGTFDVQLDNGSDATILDARVKDEKVYLLIEEELAPDATPKVDLAAGQSIADRAGNESTDRRLDGIELSDGILPTFTVMLSGGTGLNEDIDGEGPSELTKGQMKISISANEAIQGSPKFSVVCSNLTWGANADNNVAKFASNRTKEFTSAQIADAEPSSAHIGIAPINNDDGKDTRTMCPDHKDDLATGSTGAKSYFDVAVTSALARPGNNWEYQWSKLSSDQAVEDGKLSVIVWGRDRSSYKKGADTVYNYSASTANFVYDTSLMAAWDVDDGLVPSEGENVFEVRPFVLLDFPESETTVDVTTFKIDDVDHTADLMKIEDNEFVWWPEPLAYGTYKVYVEANDAANNTGEKTYSFTVKERAPFVLSLLAGWNSVSFPANPVDRALHAVFTNDAVDVVIGWDVTNPVSPWRSASKMDGVWTTHDEYGTLNDIEARYGYWVHSTGFVTQAVQLSGKGDRGTDGQPSPADIPTDTGWNFVGVVDVDGDQTQDDAGETLRNSNNDPITAAEYLGNYTRAYTWDHVNNTWGVVKTDEGITIGTGVWVYYTKDHDIAP